MRLTLSEETETGGERQLQCSYSNYLMMIYSSVERKESTRYRSVVVTPQWTTLCTNPGHASPHNHSLHYALNPRWGYSLIKPAYPTGVRPLSSGRLGSTSSRSRNYMTTASCPFIAAQLSGPSPFISGQLGSIPFRSSNNLTTPWCPLLAEFPSGLRSLLSRQLGSISPRLRNTLTTPSCPLMAAFPSAVRSYISGRFGSTSSRSNSNCTTDLCPLKAAPPSGVKP